MAISTRLSPGSHHRKIPRGLEANMTFRANLLEGCTRSRVRQQAIYQACKEDLVFFTDCFVYQINPKLAGAGRVGPFLLYDFQVEALRTMLWCAENARDLLIEKSRQMGASWLLDILFVWLFLFHPWQRLLFISRNQNAVEADNSNSLFWKLDFILRHLPDWLMPDHRGKGFVRKKLYFGNEALDSQLFGEASTGKANVGGNTTVMGIDEFSQIQDDFEVLDRTSDAAGCRIFNGTHLGTGTAFYKLATSGLIKKLQMHWSQHPVYAAGLYRYDERGNKIEVLDKNYAYPEDFRFVYSSAPAGGPYPGLRSPWYDAQCGRKSSARAVAMDLDIDPGGSAAQFFNALSIRRLVAEMAREPYWVGDLHHDRDRGTPTELRANPEGALRLWVVPVDGVRIPPAPYAAGIDVSAGSGATNSVLSVVNCRTGEKVAEFASATLRPEPFAAQAAAILRLFKDEQGLHARAAWEHAGPGVSFGARLMELGIGNVYYRKASPLHHGYINQSRNAQHPGWAPSVEAKNHLLTAYREALENGTFVNRSRLALEECLEYAYDGRGNVTHPHDVKFEDPTGARSNHGDRVVGDALAWMLVQEMGLDKPKARPPDEEVPLSLAWRRKWRKRQAQDEWADELPSTFLL